MGKDGEGILHFVLSSDLSLIWHEAFIGFGWTACVFLSSYYFSVLASRLPLYFLTFLLYLAFYRHIMALGRDWEIPAFDKCTMNWG